MILYKDNVGELFQDEEIRALIQTTPYYFTIETHLNKFLLLGFIKVNHEIVFADLIFEEEKLKDEQFMKEAIWLMIMKLNLMTEKLEEEKNNVQ